jgi:outer membrane protein TolC
LKICILNELEFATTPDVSNPDMYKGWSCKLIQHRDKICFMKNIIFFLFLVGSAGDLFSQRELDAYLKTASENNAALKSAFSEYRAALEVLPQAKALPDPQVMFQYFITPFSHEMGVQQFNLSASQMFPWFGQLKTQQQAAAEMAKAKYESFINERNKLFYQIKSVYFKLYVHHKTVHIMKENLRLMESLRELAKVKFEAGKGSLVDVLRADMEIAEMENELAYHIDLESPLRAEFEKSLNTKISGPITFPDTLWKDSLTDAKTALLDSIAANNPLLKKMDYEISYWEKQMQVAKKMGYPSFTLGAQYMNMSKRKDAESPDNGKDMFMFPEIGVMLPLNRKKYNSMVNEAKYKGEATANEKINMANELTSELEMGYRDYLNAQRRVILYTRLHTLAKNVRELLISTFSAAGTDFEEVLRMQKQELMYALELEDARAMLNTSVAYINYLTGKEYKVKSEK